jgi:hypothetical protein
MLLSNKDTHQEALPTKSATSEFGTDTTAQSDGRPVDSPRTRKKLHWSEQSVSMSEGRGSSIRQQPLRLPPQLATSSSYIVRVRD